MSTLQDDFRSAPFHLDAEALSWVESTLAGLSVPERIAQLFIQICLDLRPESVQQMIDLGVGGISRPVPGNPEALRRTAELMQQSKVPLLAPGDLEGGELNQIGGSAGTPYPNHMAVAATNDAQFATYHGEVAAREGRALGFNWTFSPVIDLDYNPGNAGVNTRSFGTEPERVMRMAKATAAALQAGGVIATMKHWPGDGMDSRNMHLVTSENTLDMETWRASYGHIYREMIASGVRTVMSAHITLPAYAHEQGQPDQADLPGSLSPLLNERLLREELGFRGLIISDATPMGGFGSQDTRRNLVWRAVMAGCDMLLFSEDLSADLIFMREALERGDLTEARLEQAVRRILALKASIGLHKRTPLPSLDGLGTPEHQQWARACSEHAVTLVRGSQHLLPLDPARHRRLLMIRQPRRISGLGFPLPDLEVPELLREAGFDVTLYTPEARVDPAHYDALLYLVAQEGLVIRRDLSLDWAELHGSPFRAMERHWHDLPTAFISFGHPYYSTEIPLCQTIVNAYSPVMPMQRAVVNALTGKIPFRGDSPVDATRGLKG